MNITLFIIWFAIFLISSGVTTLALQITYSRLDSDFGLHGMAGELATLFMAALLGGLAYAILHDLFPAAQAGQMGRRGYGPPDLIVSVAVVGIIQSLSHFTKWEQLDHAVYFACFIALILIIAFAFRTAV